MTTDSLLRRGRPRSTPKRIIHGVFEEDRASSLTHAETTLPKYQHELNIDVILPRWIYPKSICLLPISREVQEYVHVLGKIVLLAGVEQHFGKTKAQIQLQCR